MKKNYRFNEDEKRDKEVIDFLSSARNETELVKSALIFYKKAIEKRVIFDTNVINEDVWDNIFESAVPLKLVSEDRARVKAKIIKQLMKDSEKRELSSEEKEAVRLAKEAKQKEEELKRKQEEEIKQREIEAKKTGNIYLEIDDIEEFI